MPPGKAVPHISAKRPRRRPAVRRALAVLYLAVLCLAGTADPPRAGTADPPLAGTTDLALAGTGVVAEVSDGGTVVLDDGRSVRLAGIQAPWLPPIRSGPSSRNQTESRAWPFAAESKAALDALVRGRHVTVHRGEAAEDRYGRVLAHLVRDDGLWVQGEMLRAGLARVHTVADNRALAAEMLAIERKARLARRGLWSHRFYAVRTPEQAGRDLDSFQIVAGRVVKVDRVKDQVYLNFGSDWRTDFTVRIAKEAWALFDRAGLPLPALQGRVIRVRGWLVQRNGPLIEATHPEQIEPDPEAAPAER